MSTKKTTSKKKVNSSSSTPKITNEAIDALEKLAKDDPNIANIMGIDINEEKQISNIKKNIPVDSNDLDIANLIDLKKQDKIVTLPVSETKILSKSSLSGAKLDLFYKFMDKRIQKDRVQILRNQLSDNDETENEEVK